MIDLINKKFGLLTVIEYVDKAKSRGKTIWKCKCECGTIKLIQDNHLKSGNTQSCGCLRNRKGKDSPFFKGYGEIPLDSFSNIRRSAAGGGILNRKTKEFNITIQQAWNQFLKQNRRCALTNVELHFGENQTASLDRIDSNKGYIEGNIQWLHKDVNIMKNDLDMNTFLMYCKLIYENQYRKNK